MRRLLRLDLSAETRAFLERRVQQIEAAGRPHTVPDVRARAMKEEARRLWSQEDTKALYEIRDALRRMAPGHDFCMYCEGSEGSSIDHFWPCSEYPLLTYVWANHLWACSVCNSNHKRGEFPLDEQGAPLLLDPTVDEPRQHLVLDPHTGKYIGRTSKGDESIRVYGLGRGPLVKRRRAAWEAIQLFIVAYAWDRASGDTARAESTRDTLCTHPHASVLLHLLDIVDTQTGPSLVRDECIAAIRKHPEIRAWL